MRHKLSLAVLVVVLVSFLTALPVGAQKSYDAGRFDVEIQVQEDGSAFITETVDFHFEGEPFTFAFREFSAAETDGITFLDAAMDGVPMPQGTQAGQVEVREGDPLLVTWHFPPTSGSTHTFTVRYRADGVIRKGEADALIWRAVPEDHEYPIGRSTVTLIYPPGAVLLTPPSLDREFESSAGENRVVLTTGGLAEDDDLVLTAHFAPGTYSAAAPQWQVRREERNAAVTQALPMGFIGGLLTLILGGMGFLLLVRNHRRELNLGPVVPRANPPSDLSPAIAGKLTRQPHTSMGAIFDLAGRGQLEVQEQKSRWGMRNYILVRRDTRSVLEPFEQELLNILYKPGHSQVPMNEVATRLGMKSKQFEGPLEQELVQRGWLDPERKGRRSRYLVSGVLLMIVSLLVFISGIASGGISLTNNPGWLAVAALLAGISAGLFLLSIPLMVYGGTFSVLTANGEQQALLWKGFGEYLKQVSKGQVSSPGLAYFEKYLAYAAVFGLGKDWAKHFQELGGVPLPVWFHAMQGDQGDFGAMVAIMAASDTAGTSAGADGGGGGASGGGSSGAG